MAGTPLRLCCRRAFVTQDKYQPIDPDLIGDLLADLSAALAGTGGDKTATEGVEDVQAANLAAFTAASRASAEMLRQAAAEQVAALKRVLATLPATGDGEAPVEAALAALRRLADAADEAGRAAHEDMIARVMRSGAADQEDGQ